PPAPRPGRRPEPRTHRAGIGRLLPGDGTRTTKSNRLGNAPSRRRQPRPMVRITRPVLFRVARLPDQPVELPRVLADDLPDGRGRQMSELLLDVLRGLRPHAVAVGIVRAPHEGVLADLVDELGADAVELESGLALPLPVVAGLHGEAEVAEAVLPFEVH